MKNNNQKLDKELEELFVKKFRENIDFIRYLPNSNPYWIKSFISTHYISKKEIKRMVEKKIYESANIKRQDEYKDMMEAIDGATIKALKDFLKELGIES